MTWLSGWCQGNRDWKCTYSHIESYYEGEVEDTEWRYVEVGDLTGRYEYRPVTVRRRRRDTVPFPGSRQVTSERRWCKDVDGAQCAMTDADGVLVGWEYGYTNPSRPPDIEMPRPSGIW